MHDIVSGAAEGETAEAAVTVGGNRDQGTTIFPGVIDNGHAGRAGQHHIIDIQALGGKRFRLAFQVVLLCSFFKDVRFTAPEVLTGTAGEPGILSGIIDSGISTMLRRTSLLCRATASGVT